MKRKIAKMEKAEKGGGSVCGDMSDNTYFLPFLQQYL